MLLFDPESPERRTSPWCCEKRCRGNRSDASDEFMIRWLTFPRCSRPGGSATNGTKLGIVVGDHNKFAFLRRCGETKRMRILQLVRTCNLSQISLLYPFHSFSCLVLLCSPYFCEIRLNTHTRKGVTSSITNELRRTRLMSDER